VALWLSKVSKMICEHGRNELAGSGQGDFVMVHVSLLLLLPLPIPGSLHTG
jgi:hypothetical protein